MPYADKQAPARPQKSELRQPRQLSAQQQQPVSCGIAMGHSPPSGSIRWAARWRLPQYCCGCVIPRIWMPSLPAWTHRQDGRLQAAGGGNLSRYNPLLGCFWPPTVDSDAAVRRVADLDKTLSAVAAAETLGPEEGDGCLDVRRCRGSFLGRVSPSLDGLPLSSTSTLVCIGAFLCHGC